MNRISKNYKILLCYRTDLLYRYVYRISGETVIAAWFPF